MWCMAMSPIATYHEKQRAAFAEGPSVTTSALQIVFSHSARGSLNKALYDAGRNDRVVCNFDNLALGPINSPDPQTRFHWMEDELRCTGWEWVHAKEEASGRQPWPKMSAGSHGCREDRHPSTVVSLNGFGASATFPARSLT